MKLFSGEKNLGLKKFQEEKMWCEMWKHETDFLVFMSEFFFPGKMKILCMKPREREKIWIKMIFFSFVKLRKIFNSWRE